MFPNEFQTEILVLPKEALEAVLEATLEAATLFLEPQLTLGRNKQQRAALSPCLLGGTGMGVSTGFPSYSSRNRCSLGGAGLGVSIGFPL